MRSEKLERLINLAHTLEKNVNSVILGQSGVVRKILAAMISGGHVLLEDNPGTGKTTLAKSLAMSVTNTHFQRVQFTPDLLPSDILGVSMIDPDSKLLRFQQGPIFTDILLADEINRASPRTQSALLEAMAERQVTVEGKRHELRETFFVIATQNPVEFRGTYPLPEAQMDRFSMQCSLGYLSELQEIEMLESQSHHHPINDLQAVISHEELIELRQAVRLIRVAPSIQEYIVKIVNMTRKSNDVILPASPRSSISLMRTAQAMSLLEKREYVIPETVQKLAANVIGHRIVIGNDHSNEGGKAYVDRILEKIPVPA